MENIEYSLERIADLLMTITNSLQNQCQLYIQIGGLIVQIILAIITILYVAFTYKIMKANQKSAQAANEEMMAIQKQAATVLYYDLKSLEEYFILDGEMNSANVRYYNQWQDALGKCSFLGPSDIKTVFWIYDAIFDYYDSHNEYVKRKGNCWRSIPGYGQAAMALKSNEYQRVKLLLRQNAGIEE